VKIVAVDWGDINKVNLVKLMINEMYGFEYETREVDQIQNAINQGLEVYNLAFDADICVGFSGATINDKDNATIEYIYVKKSNRGIVFAYNLIIDLVKQLIACEVKKAKMQVQTYNKQRFLHYALSDKNIIEQVALERNGEKYLDQILLIEDIESVLRLSIREFMIKASQYKKEENK